MMAEGWGAGAPNFGKIVVRTGIRLIMCGLLIVGSQSAIWLAQGEWASCDLHDIVSWVCAADPSVASSLDYGLMSPAMHFPLSGALLAIGAITALAGAILSAAKADRARV